MLLMVVLLLVCKPPALGEQSSGGSLTTIFTLKQISADQGKLYLAEAGVGTVSILPGTSALVVSAGPADLAKAKAILDLVDSTEAYVVKAVLTGANARYAPSAEKVNENISGVSVGSFANPPEVGAQAGAIVDMHNNALLVLAPTGRFGDIVEVVGRLQKEAVEKAQQTLEQTPPKPGTGKIEVVSIRDANEPVNAQDVVTVVQPDQASPKISETKAAKDGNAELSLSLPEQIEIINLIDLVGKHLNLDFIYDPVKIKGEVTLKLNGALNGPLKVKHLYPLLEQVLKFKQFAMTRHGNFVLIVPVGEVMDYDPKLVESSEDHTTQNGDVLVTRMFKLKHIDTVSAENLLTGLSIGATPIAPIPDAQMLIVTDYAYRMPRIERILEMIDVPGKPKKFRFRQLKYTMAPTLAQKVMTLAEQLESVSITVGDLPSTPSTPAPGVQGRTVPGRSTPARTPTRIPQRTTPTGETSAQPSVYLDADERTNRILMIGIDEQLDLVEELIETLDVAQQDLRNLKLYKIVHVDAEDVRTKLSELGVISEARANSSMNSSRRNERITGQRGTPQSNAAAAAAGRSPLQTSNPLLDTDGSGGLTLSGEAQVVVIEATNSLLVNATPEQHAQIQTILEYVDSTTDDSDIPYIIYPLESQKPEELASVLQKLIETTITDKENKIEQVVKKTDEQIEIVPDEKSFSIIVFASKKNQDWIKKLIEQLDKPRPQVLIDVTLVEVTKSDSFEYDLNLVESFPNLLDTSGLASTIIPGENPVSSSSIISKLLSSDRDRYVDFQSAGGRGTGFYGDRHINALLTLMQEKSYGRVLAKPKILVNDNEEGTISTTDTTYVKKTSSIPVTSGTAGTQENMIQTSIDYEGYDAGIDLGITPHISEGDLLRLEITLNRTDFGDLGGDGPPDTTASDLGTVVTIPDGSTVILGGMIKLNQSKGGSKVPILGDIPLIGGLFRSVNNSDLQRRLYVFVKAEIIRPARDYAKGLPDLEKISERNRQAFEKFENRFQKYSNIPGIKPGPMDPLKVLEAE